MGGKGLPRLQSFEFPRYNHKNVHHASAARVNIVGEMRYADSNVMQIRAI